MIVVYQENQSPQLLAEQIQEPVDIWKKNHPSAKVMFVFNEYNSTYNQAEKYKFSIHCYAYGFQPDDYHREYMHQQTGHRVRLDHLMPQNRKYKICIYDYNDKKYYKVTPNFLLKHSVPIIQGHEASPQHISD